MASRTISLNVFDQSAIRRLQREVQRMSDSLEPNVDRLLERVVQAGVEEAQSIYGSAVKVSANRIDSGVWEISASGRAVVFLEFGAGDTVNTGNRYAGTVSAQGVPVESGSWSKEHAQEYSEKGYWVFGGKVMRFVKPRNAMEHAYERICQSIRSAAQEVFR